ncbi:hypothetical protein, partial [Alcanivorax sp. HI0003]|uniref:hypothetical protein n=1 Tax=Alcanivorax sp. HI0003 TaxID=1822217 RepID=UPI001E5083D2
MRQNATCPRPANPPTLIRRYRAQCPAVLAEYPGESFMLSSPRQPLLACLCLLISVDAIAAED